MFGLVCFLKRQMLSSQREVWLRYKISRHHPTLNLSSPFSLLNDDPAALTVGDNVTIGKFADIVVLAKHPNSHVPGRLSIGCNSAIGSFSNIRAAGGTISIGRDCLIGQHVSLIASNHHIESGKIYWQLSWDENRAGVVIGNNVWIGCGVTILPGVNVGNNAVVGANSVVTRNIPEDTIWAGNPARPIRSIR